MNYEHIEKLKQMNKEALYEKQRDRFFGLNEEIKEVMQDSDMLEKIVKKYYNKQN